MYDPADDTAIINPWLVACVARKIRLKPCNQSSLSQKESRSVLRNLVINVVEAM